MGGKRAAEKAQRATMGGQGTPKKAPRADTERPGARQGEAKGGEVRLREG